MFNKNLVFLSCKKGWTTFSNWLWQTVSDRPLRLTLLETSNDLSMGASNMEQISEGRGEPTGHVFSGASDLLVSFRLKALADRVTRNRDTWAPPRARSGGRGGAHLQVGEGGSVCGCVDGSERECACMCVHRPHVNASTLTCRCVCVCVCVCTTRDLRSHTTLPTSGSRLQSRSQQMGLRCRQTSSRPPPSLLQASSRPPLDLLQTSSRPPQDLLQASSRPTPDLLPGRFTAAHCSLITKDGLNAEN